jgi:Flp pilus assembly protein CpaB
VALVSYVQSAHSKSLPHPVTAYVAKQNIAAGTDAASVISQGLIETKTVDQSVVPAGAISSLNEIQGKNAAVDISQNEIILGSRFVAPGTATSGGPLLSIPPNLQAVSVEVATIPGVANFIQAGDRVSIILQLAVPTTGTLVKYIVQDVTVLQVGQRVIVPPANGQPGGASVQQTTGKVDLTLAVNANQAEKLVLGTLQGTLYFTLVPQGQKAFNTPGRTVKNEFAR